MKDLPVRKSTPETVARTQAERARQILRLQEAILLEQKARIDAVRATEPPTLPQDEPQTPEVPIVPYDPNSSMKDDSIPF